MATLSEILFLNNTILINDIGNHDFALKNLETSKFIAQNFQYFNTLKNHLFHKKVIPLMAANSKGFQRVTNFFTALKWIKKIDSNNWVLDNKVSNEISLYIKGGWLEQYVYCAQLEIGVDEARYGQVLEWKVDDVIGRNEIDVIARFGDQISFTSCKALNPFSGNGTTNQITGFMTEIDYWDTHFANSKGKLLLVTTTDLIDEQNKNAHRFPQVLGRSEVMSVDVIGLEDLPWNKLLTRIRDHWTVKN